MGYKNLGKATAESYALARKAVTLNDRDEYAHWILGFIQLWRRNYDDAIGELERAIELNPNCSLAYGSLGTVLSYAGQPEKSIANNEIAIRSNPLDISIFFRFSGISMAHFVAERYSDTAEWARRTVQRKENWWIGHILLVASLEKLDRHADARSALEQLLVLFPNAVLSDLEHLPFKRSIDAERLVEGLRLAGLPE